ncbi:unnamed protein product [Scytosiphon promiscuus]
MLRDECCPSGALPAAGERRPPQQGLTRSWTIFWNPPAYPKLRSKRRSGGNSVRYGERSAGWLERIESERHVGQGEKLSREEHQPAAGIKSRPRVGSPQLLDRIQSRGSRATVPGFVLAGVRRILGGGRGAVGVPHHTLHDSGSVRRDQGGVPPLACGEAVEPTIAGGVTVPSPAVAAGRAQEPFFEHHLHRPFEEPYFRGRRPGHRPPTAGPLHRSRKGDGRRDTSFFGRRSVAEARQRERW